MFPFLCLMRRTVFRTVGTNKDHHVNSQNLSSISFHLRLIMGYAFPYLGKVSGSTFFNGFPPILNGFCAHFLNIASTHSRTKNEKNEFALNVALRQYWYAVTGFCHFQISSRMGHPYR